MAGAHGGYGFATNTMRSSYLWKFHMCSLPWTMPLMPYTVGTVVLSLLVGYMQTTVMRQQFMMRLELQRVKDERIEQLDREKARLTPRAPQPPGAGCTITRS